MVVAVVAVIAVAVVAVATAIAVIVGPGVIAAVAEAIVGVARGNTSIQKAAQVARHTIIRPVLLGAGDRWSPKAIKTKSNPVDGVFIKLVKGPGPTELSCQLHVH